MSFLNRFWRIPALALVVALPIFSACADDEGATPQSPTGPGTGTISGQVTSSAGGPIVGALVGTSPATNTGLTDANGNYSITNVPIPGGSAAYAVTASAAGFQSASTSVTLTTANPTATANLVLTAGAVETDGSLNVLVTNREGTPQSGATVTVNNASGATVTSGTTNAQGFLLVPTIAAGSYTVFASHTISGVDFQAAGGVNVVAGETAFIQLTLSRDFDQSVFPNVDGEAATPVDLVLIPVPGNDDDPDIDCNIIRTQHMFIVEARDATHPTNFNRVSGVKIQWDLNTSENGTVTTTCPTILEGFEDGSIFDDDAGCGVPTVPGNTGTIVDSDDPDLDPTTARSGLAPSFNVDSRQAVTFTNDSDQTISFGGTSVNVGAGQSWIIVTSPVEGQTDLIVSSSDISRAGGDVNADKEFAIKRWVNWDTAVAEVQWPDQEPNIPGWQPGPTRDFFDADDTTFNEIEDGDVVINILDRRELSTEIAGGEPNDNESYPFDFGCDSDVSTAPGFQCELTGNRALFLASVERLRSDSPFNLSRGAVVFAELDDNPDVEFWGDDGGDGCTVGVCNVEHNGPTDNEYIVDTAPVPEDGPGNDSESAAAEFDANNNILSGGVITMNPLCSAPCDEDDFIGWAIAEVRLDPTVHWCHDVDSDGDCDPGQAGSADSFSTAYQRLLAGTTDNRNTFSVQFFDEFGEVCDELTFEKRWVTSRLRVIKSTPDAALATVEGFSVKRHTVQVGQTFSYTVTAINEGDIQTVNVRITDTLPRFGDQFSVPHDPLDRGGNQAFEFIRDRPAFDPTAVVYAIDSLNNDPGDFVDRCIRGDNGSTAGNAYVVPAPCVGITIDAGTVEQARTAAISRSSAGAQVVFIQWFDEQILGRTQVGGGIQSEDTVEVFLRATAALYTGLDLTGVNSTWCNIATVTDGPNNRLSDVLTQSFDADTLCHEVRQALLDVRKTAQDAVLSAGTMAVWDVEVANLGSTALTSVVIHDTLDAAFLAIDETDVVVNTALFPSATVSVDAGGHTFSVDLGSLAPTAGLTGAALATCRGGLTGSGGGFCLAYTVSATLPDVVGVFCNRVTARGTNAAGTLIETDISCVTTTIAIELDIANEDGFLDGSGTFQSAKDIFHVGDGSPAEADSLIYELRVTNQSGFTATGVRIVDLVAPNTGIIEWRATRFVSQGTVTATSDAGFTWNVGTLPPNTGATLRFQAEAVSTGDDVNRASLTADQLTGVKVSEEPTTVSP